MKNDSERFLAADSAGGNESGEQKSEIIKISANLSAVKRFFDAVFSVIFIAVLSPVYIIVSLCILITDKRPVFFRQTRVGKNSVPFTCYKFRSMRVDVPGYVEKHKLENAGDAITKFGSYIRRTSIDELPQLFNILKGDMSFVGPRPLIENHEAIHEGRRKYGIDQLRPGLTGYAQVMGRDSISDEEKVVFDKYYLENCSLLFDLKIIVRTVGVVFMKKGYKEGK